MFMKPDGNFTLKNVFINEGDSVCVIVLVSFCLSRLAPSNKLNPGSDSWDLFLPSRPLGQRNTLDLQTALF